LKHGSKEDNGGKNRPRQQLSSLPLPMTLMREMGRKGARSGLGTKCILPRPASDVAPQLITSVQTTPAPLSDEGVVSTIHAELAKKELLPAQHLVDSGYVTIATLVQSQSGYGVDLLGPTLKTHWYQAETGYDLTHFSIDWEAETVTCPQGRSSSSWTPVQDAGKSLIKVKFSISCDSSGCIAVIVLKICRKMSLYSPALEILIVRKVCRSYDLGSICLPRKGVAVSDRNVPVLHLVPIQAANLSDNLSKNAVIVRKVCRFFLHSSRCERSKSDLRKSFFLFSSLSSSKTFV